MVSGPVETLIVALVAIAALLLWLRRDKRPPGPRLLSDGDGIDHERLEAAELEVRDLDPERPPDDPLPGHHWTWGAPRPPERL